MVNRVTVTGHLGADPDTKTLPSGVVATTVRLASTDRYRDKASSEAKEATEWHRVIFYGRLAEVARDYLAKGARIYIDGKLRTRKWQTSAGEDRYVTEIVAEHLEMLGGPRAGTPAAEERDPEIDAWAQAYERADAEAAQP